MNGIMDEREMTSGGIPLRHASLPGHVKLPRRYEKAAMGTNGIPARVRKISIQPGHSVVGDSLSDRLDDLMAATMWVKQELIMLRQHDILLKRQFFNIQHSIQSLQKPRSPAPSTSAKPSTSSTSDITSTTDGTITSSTTTNSEPHVNGEVPLEEQSFQVNGPVGEVDCVFQESDIVLDTYMVRPSSSVTLLKEESEEEEERDTFCEDLYYRPRTSSMRTSRDMAALARRRGSKELI